jgi:hypothetical protein
VNVEFEFTYRRNPEIPFLVVGAETGLSVSSRGFIDTGADITVLDARIASRIGVNLNDLPEVAFRGITGSSRGARLGEVEILLLARPELSTVLEVLFVENFSTSIGNLIGLNLLSRFDLALEHSRRTGYIGRTAR